MNHVNFVRAVSEELPDVTGKLDFHPEKHDSHGEKGGGNPARPWKRSRYRGNNPIMNTVKKCPDSDKKRGVPALNRRKDPVSSDSPECTEEEIYTGTVPPAWEKPDVFQNVNIRANTERERDESPEVSVSPAVRKVKNEVKI